MNSEDTFWTLLWAMGLTSIVLIVYFSLNYWIDHNTKIVELIKEGVPAKEALCTLKHDYGQDPVCIINAVKATSTPYVPAH